MFRNGDTPKAGKQEGQAKRKSAQKVKCGGDASANGAVFPNADMIRLMNQIEGGKGDTQAQEKRKHDGQFLLFPCHGDPPFLCTGLAVLTGPVKNREPGVPRKAMLLHQMRLNGPQLGTVEMNETPADRAAAVKMVGPFAASTGIAGAVFPASVKADEKAFLLKTVQLSAERSGADGNPLSIKGFLQLQGGR